MHMQEISFDWTFILGCVAIVMITATLALYSLGPTVRNDCPDEGRLLLYFEGSTSLGIKIGFRPL